MSNELGSAGISSALQGRYETRGEAPIFALGSELFPVVGASDSWMDPELHFGSGSRLAWFNTALQPTAGQFACSHLTNPANSGVIAVVQRVVMVNRAAAATVRQTMRVEGGPLSVAAGAAGVVRDSRYGFGTTAAVGTARTSLSAGSISLAALVGAQVFSCLLTATRPTIVFDIPVVLGPGSRLWVTGGSVDVQVETTYVWRERKIEQGELRNTR